MVISSIIKSTFYNCPILDHLVMFHKIYLCKFSQISDLFLTEVHIFYSCRCIHLTDMLAVTRIAVKSSGFAPGILTFFI